MLSVSALVTDVRKQLCELRETVDVTGLQGLVIKVIVLENIMQHVIQKKGCDRCPSCGKELNRERAG